MSNRIPYDPLLVRYLARELDERLRGRACAAAPLFAARLQVSLPVDGAVLDLDLHPSAGWIRLLPPDDPGLPPLDARISGVDAPPDERRLRIRIEGADRFRASERTLVVELHTNQWNALLVSDEGFIVSALRARRAGSRLLMPGQPYEPPEGNPRFGADEVSESLARDRWTEEIAGAEEGHRRRSLLSQWAYTGAANVDWILAAGSEMDASFRRWWWIRSLPRSEPVLLRTGGALVPYPLRLAGMPAEPAPSLLAAMQEAAESGGDPEAETALTLPLEAVASRTAAAARRVARLEEELADTGRSEELRGLGDLLLANLHRVPRGAEQVELEGWDGAPVTVALNPELSGPENAARWYDQARRRARAEQRIPLMLEEAREELRRWRAASASLEAGEIPPWLEAELERRMTAEATQGRDANAPSLPYRRFRTSGGLEVRVGRSAKGNDRLTFQNSSPDDVWLHARSVAGSHVVLRWPDAAGAPPARDLAEAAGLAALFSKARTSSLVAVDWTRRKHVRKPRGSAAGLVIPQRVKTIFVEPDPELEERLRVD